MTGLNFAVTHIMQAWNAGITVGVNPPGLLRAAVDLADVRRPEESFAAAVYAAEAVRHLLRDRADIPGFADLRAQAGALSEQLQQAAAHHFREVA